MYTEAQSKVVAHHCNYAKHHRRRPIPLSGTLLQQGTSHTRMNWRNLCNCRPSRTSRSSLQTKVRISNTTLRTQITYYLYLSGPLSRHQIQTYCCSMLAIIRLPFVQASPRTSRQRNKSVGGHSIIPRRQAMYRANCRVTSTRRCNYRTICPPLISNPRPQKMKRTSPACANFVRIHHHRLRVMPMQPLQSGTRIVAFLQTKPKEMPISRA